jgi:hypothetical protein
VNASKLGGLLPSAFAKVGTSNTFTADQTINGNLNLTGSLALSNTTGPFTGVIRIGGTPVLHTFGTRNTFVGPSAGNFTMTGPDNTAVGFGALFANTTGNGNTATGWGALEANTTGGTNTATGVGALFANTTGNDNPATGNGALRFNTTGNGNTALGSQAMFLGDNTNNNTAIGFFAGVGILGNNNTIIGFRAGDALTTGDNNIDIGSNVLGAAGESNTIRIGNNNPNLPPVINRAFIAGIYGVPTGLPGAAVVVDANGQLGTMSSSRRFKDDIQDMGDASSDLMKLRPVTFRYKQAQEDGSHPLQYGLVAEEVADVNPGLVAV